MAIKYYVRKSWEDTSSQQGAYNVLSNAVAVCDNDTSYRVYDADGGLVYNPWYYVRPSVEDTDSQSGAYRVYANATADADKRGYQVYDYLGVPRYPTPYTVQLTASTPYYKAADGEDKAGTAAKGIYTITSLKSPYGWLKSGAGWIDLWGLDVYSAASSTTTTTKSPLQLAADNVAAVYAKAIGCKHVSGSYTWDTAMSKKQVNCAIMASRVAYLAGLTDKDKLISHTTAVKSNIISQKGTISKAMSGYSNLDTTKCTVKWVGKTYSNLASKYRVPGAIYVYDSNIAVCGGNGVIYSCNNGSNQLSNGVYAKNAMTSGYCFTSPVLVVILPNS